MINLGADFNNVDIHGQTCIFYAARTGKTSVCKVLVDSGASPNHVDKKG